MPKPPTTRDQIERMLTDNPDMVYPVTLLAYVVYGCNGPDEQHAIRVTVHRLRRLKPYLGIRTINGRGYTTRATD